MRANRSPAVLLLVALASMAAATPGSGADPLNVNPALRNSSNGPTYELKGELFAPPYAFSGEEFNVGIEVRMQGPGVTFVKILPSLPGDANACSVVAFTISVAIEVGPNTFLMSNSTIPGLSPGSGDPVSERVATPYIGLDFTFRANGVGECRIKAEITDLLEILQEPIPLEAVIPISLMPPQPVFLGALATTGSLDTDDDAEALPPAPPSPVPVLVLTNKTKVALVGLADHSDGYDNGDYGVFVFKKDGGEVYRHRIYETPVPQTLIAETTVNQKRGGVAETQSCFWAQYVDGGWWDTPETPTAEYCVTIQAAEPKDVPNEVATIPAICQTALLPTTLAEIARLGYAVEPGVGSLTGQLVSLDQHVVDLCLEQEL